MTACVKCGRELPRNAVLCIACGFHLEKGITLTPAKIAPANPFADSEVQEESDEEVDDSSESGLSNESGKPDNPYAPIHEGQQEEFITLDEKSAVLARRIVESAIPIYLSVLMMLCFMLPVLPVLFPYYLMRSVQWWHYHRTYPQLRSPNSLSPYAEIEVEFFSAGMKHIVAATCGLLAVLRKRTVKCVLTGVLSS
ncbi:MAG: hypothetical protein AAF394_04900 [Planctomycetota bacterium]